MARTLPFVCLCLLLIYCAGSREEEQIQEILANNAAYFTEKGAAALDANDYDTALQYFRRAAQTLPNNPQMADNLGVAYFRAGKLDSAIAVYQTALHLQPSFTKAYVDMGYAYLEKKNYPAAQQSGREALLHEPASAAAYLLLARTAEAQGELNSAEKQYQEAIRLAPEDYTAYLYLASLYDDRGDLDAAIDFYQQAAERKPSEARIYFNIGNVYARKCKLDDALAFYDKALRVNPQMTGALNNHGMVLISRDDLDGALTDLNRALKIDSTASPVLFNLSVVHDQLGSPAEALNFVTRAIQIDSTVAVFYLQKGNILTQLGQTELAIKSFAKAIALEPTNAMIYNNLGNALYNSDDVEQAKLTYQQALDLYPDFLESRYFAGSERFEKGVGDLLGACADASQWIADYAMMYANLGRAKLLMGKLDEAQQDLERAVNMQPLLIQPYEQLALLYQQRKDRTNQNRMLAHARLNQARTFAAEDSSQLALEACRQALRFDPFLSEAYAEMGNLYSLAGDTKSATAAFKNALKQKDNNPQVHLLYALYLSRQEDKTKALSQYEKAIALNPNHIDLRQAYAAFLDSLGHADEASRQRAWSHYLVGQQLQAVGRWEAALEEYQTAVGLTADNAEYLAAQGLLYAKKKLLLEAELLLQQALEQNSANVTALYGMGIVKSEQKRFDEALDYLNKAVALDPRHGRAHYALAVIYHDLGDQTKQKIHLAKAQEAGLRIDNKLFDESSPR
jgi:tetratricopeptide (TPR) repeat protein